MWQLQIMNIFKKKKDILMQHSWSAFSEKLHKINLSWLNYCYQSQYMDFTGMGGSRLVNCPAAADKPARPEAVVLWLCLFLYLLPLISYQTNT